MCVTPSWGSVHIANQVQVSLVKGAYTYPQTSSYKFVPSWHQWSSSTGPVGGGERLTIIGVGFNTSKLHRCLFDYNAGQLVAYSEPVLPESKMLLVCVTPVWKSWRDSSTRLKLLSGEAPSSPTALTVKGMTEVLQMVTRQQNFLNASYHFRPGFIVSSKDITLRHPGDLARFTFRPDTELTGDVEVFITSSDTSVVSVTSPYQLDAAATIQSNTKEVSLMHIGPGVASLSLASRGAPYGFTFSNFIRVLCRGSLVVTADGIRNSVGGSRGSMGNNLTAVSAVTSIVLQRDESLHLRIAPLQTASADAVSSVQLKLLTSIEPALASPVASVHPSNVTVTATAGNQSFGHVRVTCHTIGHASLMIQVSEATGAASSIYTDVSLSVPIECRPGIVLSFAGTNEPIFTPSFVRNLVRVQPSEELHLSIALDTSPTTRTELYVSNSAPDIVQLPSSIVMPPFSSHARILRVKNLQMGAGDAVVNIVASSPGMLERMNQGCSGAEAGKCTALFRDQENCSFDGFRSNGTRGDKHWVERMDRISTAAGSACDLETYHNCYRIACCASAEALACTTAVERAHCNVSMLVPELADSSQIQDASADFGVPAVSAEQQAELYSSWVAGIKCDPYVACAWARCFPGKGNYEQVAAHTLTIRALPGFRLEPPFVALNQGADRKITIVLDLTPSTPIIVRLAVISDLSMQWPVAKVEPDHVSFAAGETRADATLRWMGAGRASLQLTTDFPEQPEAGKYTNVTQVIPLVISASPGFVYSSQDTSVASGFEPGEFPVLFLQVGSSSSLHLKPSFDAQSPFTMAVSDDAGLLETTPTEVGFTPPFAAAHVSFSSTRVGSTLLQFRSHWSQSETPPPSNESMELLVYGHGFGYTAGTMSLGGYPAAHAGAASEHDTGFSASYAVGVLSWGYYHDPDTLQPLRGHDYYFGGANFDGPILNASSAGSADGRMRVDKCWGSATVVLQHGVAIGHSGHEVAGCEPSMQFSIVGGRVDSISFDNRSCLVTGLTCKISLPDSRIYSGAGFSGYFTTGITGVSLESPGSGYLCDWACVLSVHSSGVSPLSRLH